MSQPEVRAVLFDLGNTLAAYYRKHDFRPILERSLIATRAALDALGVAPIEPDLALTRALAEHREAPDYRFTPMLERLQRIFEIPPSVLEQGGNVLCSAFLAPIFATARVYDDVVPALASLEERGYRLGIVSNSPWGSPPLAWRNELGRLGLATRVHAIVLCGDVGWRKPARAIFDEASRRLGVPNRHCVFVGDDLDWDVAGAHAAGMRSILIDRDGAHRDFIGTRIERLTDLALCLATAGAH